MNKKRLSRISLAVLALACACGPALAQGGPPSDAAAGSPDKRMTDSRRSEARLVTTAKPPSLSLAPAVVMTKGNFGQSVTQTLTLTNSTSAEMAFDLVAEDVVVREGKRVFVPAGELPHSIAATAVFSNKDVLVQPFSTASVDVRFTIPAGSPIRAVVAIFRGTTKVRGGAGSVAMTASLGTLLTFTMSEVFTVEPQSLTVSPQTDSANASFSEWLRNTGSEPVVPGGVVAVLDSGGALVSKGVIEPQRLLPGEHLEFRAECPSQLQPGKYRALASFQFEGQTLTRSTEFIVQ